MIGKRISKKLESILVERETFHNNNGKQPIDIVENETFSQNEQIICPIICEGDVIVSVIIAAREGEKQMTGIEEKLAAMASDFLGRRMDA